MLKLATLAATATFAISLSTTALACSCGQLAPDFWGTVSAHNGFVSSGEWPRSQELTVVEGRVTEHLSLRQGPYPTELVLEVDGVLQGEVASRRLIIEGDNGMQCRPYVTNFPVGTRWVMAVGRGDEDTDNYYISVCGEYALQVKAVGG